MSFDARYAIPALGTCFLLVLLVVTLRSTPTPLDLTTEDRASAQRACRSSVRARLPGARFPHGANVGVREGGRLHLSGSVDAGSPTQAVRRNYECLLRRLDSGAYVADSVLVWQSH